MNKKTIRIAGWALGLSVAIGGIGAAVSAANIKTSPVVAMPSGGINDYTDIVSGKSYYIGATTGGNDYYLSVDGSSLTASIAGTAVSSVVSATPFVFSGSGTSWTIQFGSGYYLGLKDSKDNGKVQVLEDAATFTASNQSSKIRLTIGNYSIQKNNSGTQFGSYGNTQTDLWLLEASNKTATETSVSAAEDKTILDCTQVPADTVQLSAEVTYNEGTIDDPDLSWESNNPSIATVSSDGLVTAVAKGVARITVSYAGDSTYRESSDYIDITVVDPNEIDFADIPGLASWGTSYKEHVVVYERGTVTFDSASKQGSGSSIDDIPVTKGQPVSFVAADGYYLGSAEFVCRQWTDKAQTITLHYSTNGGSSYTSTGVTSTNFTISKNNLASKTNAVKITFSSSSNQVGIESLTVSYIKTWSRNFLDTFTCYGAVEGHPNGDIKVDNPTDVWAAFATSFSSLTDAEKANFKTLSASGSSVDAQAMARYDLVIRKYGKAVYDDFIGRFEADGANPSGANMVSPMSGSTNNALLVVGAVMGTAAVAAGLGFGLTRKRKED